MPPGRRLLGLLPRQARWQLGLQLERRRELRPGPGHRRRLPVRLGAAAPHRSAGRPEDQRRRRRRRPRAKPEAPTSAPKPTAPKATTPRTTAVDPVGRAARVLDGRGERPGNRRHRPPRPRRAPRHPPVAEPVRERDGTSSATRARRHPTSRPPRRPPTPTTAAARAPSSPARRCVALVAGGAGWAPGSDAPDAMMVR